MNKSNSVNKMEWKILCTACGKNPWYFNIASLHYEWTGGRQTYKTRQLWYKHLISIYNKNLIKAYIDHYTPTQRDSNLFDISYIEVDKIDFRRRMHFRATRRGWGMYYKMIRKGIERPEHVTNGGYWIVEDIKTGQMWKEDIYGNLIE
jgi:hypothetical protein